MSELTRDETATPFSRPNYQARTETGKKSIFPVQQTTDRIGSTRLTIHTARGICVETLVWNHRLSKSCVRVFSHIDRIGPQPLIYVVSDSARGLLEKKIAKDT